MDQHAPAHPAPTAFATPTEFGANATRDVVAALNGLLADVLALHVKTRNSHRNMSGLYFRDHQLTLDEQANELFAMTDVLADRLRKVGHLRLHSLGEVARNQRISDGNSPSVMPQNMLAELREDNSDLAERLREAHGMVDEQGDVATASLLEMFIDEAEWRAWFL